MTKRVKSKSSELKLGPVKKRLRKKFEEKSKFPAMIWLNTDKTADEDSDL